ncbi:response regulator [Sulfurovum lithotrophicum]|uniref:response regulator n=1 Tax=Sulfurovum lithotrophicum TaxID=206403 RepID=UPI000698EC48|nr:response regulator [Sulfurovum lithotrophicum]
MINKKLEILIKLSKDLTVLYVEDNTVVHNSTLGMMEDFFLKIDSAENGETGLQKYKKYYNDNNQYYDIVITDIKMPKLNGIEMSRSILSLNEEQIILIISAHNESDYLLELINMGISNFILKPIDITQFQKKIFHIATSLQNKKVIKKQYEDIQRKNLILAAAKKEAEYVSYQKSQFLANMSHEIRTPLNAITGFISLLHENETDAEKLKYLQVIKSSSDSLLQIISDILDISKIDNGNLEIDNINFNPYEELITVMELFQKKASQKNIAFEIEFADDIPKFLFSDIHRIKQILSNLLSNAVKFTPKGLSIKCSVYYEKECLTIRVQDTGIGIPANKQKLIFEPFLQAEHSTSREYGGTGLGLSISARLAELLGGTLTLKSQETMGSTFTLAIDMPVSEDIHQECTQSIELTEPLKGHILIVEDIEANQMFLGIILNNAGLTYDTAINGIEAIEKFKTTKYDLILMDENMPKMGGTAATKVILTMEKEGSLKHTPIISLTANALKGDKERFLKAGMDEYLSKPVDPSSLTSTLRKYLIKI